MKDHINQIIENRTRDPGVDSNTSSRMDRNNLDHNTMIEDNNNTLEITTHITIIKTWCYMIINIKRWEEDTKDGIINNTQELTDMD